jgi:hypothetical protein
VPSFQALRAPQRTVPPRTKHQIRQHYIFRAVATTVAFIRQRMFCLPRSRIDSDASLTSGDHIFVAHKLSDFVRRDDDEVATIGSATLSSRQNGRASNTSDLQYDQTSLRMRYRRQALAIALRNAGTRYPEYLVLCRIGRPLRVDQADDRGGSERNCEIGATSVPIRRANTLRRQ